MITYQAIQQVLAPVGIRPSWREEAITAYRQIERERPLALRMDLATRVQALTGTPVAPDSVYVNREAGTATVAVAGCVFRLTQRELAILRPCAYCGTGQFTSPAIESLADLDYALIGWEPLHDDCQPTDADDSL